MALRKAHGRHAAALLVSEALPSDELPPPLPVNLAVLPAPLVRREDGTIADSASAKALGAKGGLAKAAKRKALGGLGMTELAEDHDYHPFWKAAEQWLEFVGQEYAVTSGGTLGPTAYAILGSAANLLAQSRFWHAKAAEENVLKQKIEYGLTAKKFDDAFRQACTSALDLARAIGGNLDAPPVDPYAIIAKLAAQQDDDPPL